MKNQSADWHQWVVVDDGEVPTIPTLGQEVVYRTRAPEDPGHTLVLNLREALPRVEGDLLLFVEDDDYYAPRYIDRMVEKAEGVDMVGECRNTYYHVGARKWYQFSNEGHASLCATGLRREQFPALEKLLGDPHPYVDMRLWRLPFIMRRTFLDDPRLVVGLKGMPGRTGICRGHDPNDARYRDDPDLSVFRSLLGRDADAYKEFM